MPTMLQNIRRAYLRASIEADRLITKEREKYSELNEPLALQTRDLTWKPECRQAIATAIDTLRLLKKNRPVARRQQLCR